MKIYSNINPLHVAYIRIRRKKKEGRESRERVAVFELTYFAAAVLVSQPGWREAVKGR